MRIRVFSHCERSIIKWRHCDRADERLKRKQKKNTPKFSDLKEIKTFDEEKESEFFEEHEQYILEQ